MLVSCIPLLPALTVLLLQVWVSGAGAERMPVWCPPTPPAADGDVYCPGWARVLYRAGAAAEASLPAAAGRSPRARSPRRRVPPRAAPAPPSLFERAGPRPRPRPRQAQLRDAPPAPDWAAPEDAALRRALRLQRLPAEPPAALAPNWEWVAELVNDAARAYRSARQARDRHDALADPERARRKHKKPAGARRRPDDEAPRPPLARLEAMREAAERRRAQPKRRLDDAAHHNPKHAALLADHGVDYDAPPTPMEVASRRAERIAKEKQKAGTSAGPAPPALPAPAPAPPPQRIVVAAHAPAPRPAAVTAAALYRHQALATRHHLKILHHAPHAQGSGVAGSSEGGAGAALRTLQLQQLALRRAAPGVGPRGALPHSHVVVAHLTPAAPPAAAAPAPAPAASAPSQPPHEAHHDDRAM